MPSLVAESPTKVAPPPLPLTHAHAEPAPAPAPAPAGFWLRSLAHLIDSTLFSLVITPVLLIFILPDLLQLVAQAQNNPGLANPLGVLAILHSPAGLLIQYGLPAIAVIILWRWRSATPGKMMLGLRIVDAATLDKPSTVNLVIRFFGYIASMLPLCLGFMAVAWDPRKQGWHDKLARTLVVKTRPS